MPEFYLNYGPGIVVSSAIDRFVYVTLNEKFDGKVSVRYSMHENVEKVFQLQHSLIREMLLHYGITNGVEIVIVSDVPARGSGLGASSTMLVALCLALECRNGKISPRSAYSFPEKFKTELAENAAKIEIEICNSPIGKQDHYSAAFGGINRIRFEQDGHIEVTPFGGSYEFVKELENQSMLFYLDMEREYKDGHLISWILKDQLAELHEKRKTHEMQRDNATELWEHMTYEVMERFMDHVNENWRLKRTVHSKITNTAIDHCVQRAYSAGATAAKVCGAGGGGFIYLVVPVPMQDSVRAALSDLHELSFGFSPKGAEVIFSEGSGSLEAVH